MFRVGKKFLLFCLISLICSVSFAQSVADLFKNSGSPVGGNPDGKITIAEFFDYSCPHCMNAAPVIEAVTKDNADVRIIYIDYPILGEESEYAARAALAAEKQGKYIEFSQALLLLHQQISEDSVMNIAKILGLDLTKLQKDMDSDSVTSQLEANLKLGQDFEVNGTPAFIIGKTNATNPKDLVVIYGETNESDIGNAIKSISK